MQYIPPLKISSKGCKHSANAFCFVHGEFIKTRARKHSVQASIRMCESYKAYFGVLFGDQDKSWAPYFVCDYFIKILKSKKRKLPDAFEGISYSFLFLSGKVHFVLLLFSMIQRGNESNQVYCTVPRIWREPNNHSSDCNFCLVDPSKR